MNTYGVYFKKGECGINRSVSVKCVLYAGYSVLNLCINILVVLIQMGHYHILLSVAG